MTTYQTKRAQPAQETLDWNSFWATCPQCQHRYGISIKLIGAYLDRLFASFATRRPYAKPSASAPTHFSP